MPRNLYQRGGIWYGRIQVGGEELRQSLRTRDKREAERRLKDWREGLSPYYGTTQKTYADAAGAWVEAAEDRHTEKTWRRYMQSLRYLDPHFGKRMLAEVNRTAIAEFMAVRRREGARPPTVKRDLTVLSLIMAHAETLGWIGTNPVTPGLRRALRAKTPPFQRPPATDIAATLAACYGAIGPLAEFILETGLRMDEARLLKRTAVDLARRTARLDRTKNGTVRTVSLSPRAVAIAKAQPKTSEYLFTTRDGTEVKRLSEGWREATYRARAKAEQEGRPFHRISIHGLRHEYAIRYLERGGNLYLLQQQLGHGSIRQTEQYLQFLSPEAQMAAKLGATVGT